MIILDNFLSDTPKVNGIMRSPFWEDRSFYFSEFENQNSIGGYIVSEMIKSPLLKEYPFSEACGYEYWPSVFVPGTAENGYSLEVHSDYDVIRYVETDEVKYPMFGAIMYFGNLDVEGGLFRLWNEDGSFHEVEPKHNRLIVFDSSMQHGVTEVTKGIRRSIAINFWLEPIMTKEGSLV